MFWRKTVPKKVPYEVKSIEWDSSYDDHPYRDDYEWIGPQPESGH